MSSPAADGAPAGRVVLYGRAGCHLCDDARDVLAAVVPADLGWTEVDIDTDPGLQARYGEYVPVVTVDDVQVGFWRVDPERVRRALGSRP
ncbi:glutaredoxin [Actinotalea ferrariae CF5-4]|uniref:Glutaredoxin n=1 Tax=Actinotalea ferrariae CF5-4 TaxID=948458 RepID=A0A021VNW7_9CELL|nr:glutaredoxin family protein [Actinotalea ferrariae]EYR62849.1 glutaredoxin [Actinotalea ferrariae CF5-4]